MSKKTYIIRTNKWYSTDIVIITYSVDNVLYHSTNSCIKQSVRCELQKLEAVIKEIRPYPPPLHSNPRKRKTTEFFFQEKSTGYVIEVTWNNSTLWEEKITNRYIRHTLVPWTIFKTPSGRPASLANLASIIEAPIRKEGRTQR